MQALPSPFSRLPSELKLYIFSFLDWESLKVVALVSTTWRSCVKDRASHLFNQRKYGPAYFRLSSAMTLPMFDLFAAMNDFPMHTRTLMIQRIPANVLHVPKNIDLFGVRQLSPSTCVYLNGARNVLLFYKQKPFRDNMLPYCPFSGCAHVKTAFFSNTCIYGTMLSDFTSLESCVFINVELLNVVFPKSLKRVLFFGCHITVRDGLVDCYPHLEHVVVCTSFVVDDTPRRVYGTNGPEKRIVCEKLFPNARLCAIVDQTLITYTRNYYLSFSMCHVDSYSLTKTTLPRFKTLLTGFTGDTRLQLRTWFRGKFKELMIDVDYPPAESSSSK